MLRAQIAIRPKINHENLNILVQLEKDKARRGKKSAYVTIITIEDTNYPCFHSHRGFTDR